MSLANDQRFNRESPFIPETCAAVSSLRSSIGLCHLKIAMAMADAGCECIPFANAEAQWHEKFFVLCRCRAAFVFGMFLLI